MAKSKLILLLLFVLAPSAAHAGESAQLKLLDRPLWVFPDQTFRIAVEQSAQASSLRVEAPSNVQLYDRWVKGSIHRLYFRARSAGEVTVTLRDESTSLEVSLEVLAWSDVFERRKFKNLDLPRIWPTGEFDYRHIKRRHTFFTKAELQAMRRPNEEVRGLARRWLEKTDDEIWNIIPGPSVPRTCLIVLSGGNREDGRGKGCPVCGMDVYEGRSGFYPWVFDAENHPWKVGCPSCGTWFPSNNWHEGDMHSGDFPDDGFGCEPAQPLLSPNGTPWRWPFIAYYHEWEAYMRQFTPGIEQSAQAFARTGDRRYAHKTAVALFRFAESMLDMSLNLNHRKMAVRDAILRGPIGAPSPWNRLSGTFLYIQPNWDTPRMEQCARAWDMVFDAIDGDQELLDFCQDHHHPEIQTIDDFRHFVEAGVIRVPLQACLDNAVSRNYPMQEALLATLALVMDSPRSVELADKLLYGEAGIRFTLTNDFFKDGSACESESYNNIHIRDMNRILDLLDRNHRLYPRQWEQRALSSPSNDPKYRRMYDFPIENSLIGHTTSWTGDTSHSVSSEQRPPMQGFPLQPRDFVRVFRLTQDPRFAQAMVGPRLQIPAELDDPGLREQVEKIVDAEGWQVKLSSNILDGYGHAILRSGAGQHERAVWLRYGRVKQHAHQDLLTMGFAALGRDMLPELGYPQGWTHASQWAANWGTHYGTHITGVRTADFGRGRLTLFADTPPARAAAATTTLVRGDSDAMRTRTIVLVDLSEKDAYAVTLERVLGGTQHTFSFHGPDGEATPHGIELTPQIGGTVLDADSAYGDYSSVSGVDAELASLAFMYDVQRGKPDRIWSLDCLLRDQEDVHLRTTVIGPPGGDLAVAKGKPPQGNKSYEMSWTILQHTGQAPMASQFVTVLEPYQRSRRVRRIESVPVSGPSKSKFEPIAIRVESDQFVDTILFQPAGDAHITTEDGISTDAEYAFWRERNGRCLTAVLAGGTYLEKSDDQLSLSESAYRGTIRRCDWENRTILVQPIPERVDELPGGHIQIANALGSHASYRIEAVKRTGEECQITLPLDPRIGEGIVDSCSDGGLKSKTRLRFHNYWDYYAGKTIANETGSVTYPLRNLTGAVICVLAAPGDAVRGQQLTEEFADLDGDGRSRFVIYDYGPGDDVIIKRAGRGQP